MDLGWSPCIGWEAGARCLQQRLVSPYPQGWQSQLALNKVGLGLGFRVGAPALTGELGLCDCRGI